MQGFIHHKDELEIVINDMRPDIVCITETHVTKDIEEHEIDIKNYNSINVYSGNKRTGGVTIYLRKEIKFKELQNVVDLGEEEKNMWISNVKLEGKYEKGDYQ